MFIKLKTISRSASIAVTVALLASCADSGEATGSAGAGEIIETGAAEANPPASGTGNVAAPDPVTTPVAEIPGAAEPTEPEETSPPVITPVDTTAAAIIAEAAKSGTSTGSADTDFNFPEITPSADGLSMTIPDGALPEFGARRTLISGTGQSIEFGDAVVLKYDMFSWTNGALVESSSQLEGPYAVSAGVSDNIPEYLAKSLLGRRLGETMQIVFPVGMEDLPDYMDPNDAYVLVVELL